MKKKNDAFERKSGKLDLEYFLGAEFDGDVRLAL